jgi:hypothetical protein
MFSDLETIRSVWLQGGQETLPSLINQSIYELFFENYLDLYQAITAMTDSLAATSPKRR